MRRSIYPLGLAVAAAFSGCSHTPLHTASHALKAHDTHSIEFAGSGRWYQFGQAPNPSLAWPPFNLSSYTADINYDSASAKVQIVRKQIIEPGRNRPLPVEQKPEQYVAGTSAWNVAVPNNTPPGTAAVATWQPAAVEERSAEIIATPQGFVKAARANKETRKVSEDGKQVSFTVGGKYRYEGSFNDQGQLASVKTWIDSPVLGDTLVETKFSDYRDFGSVQFPAHIERSQGGYPVLDLNVASVKLNPAVEIAVPQELASTPAAAVTVKSEKLADGVYYLTGGTHHSVAIEQKDHVVLVEAPLNEERSVALIAKIREIIPGKPIKYVVNSHAHFDHSGGLRTFVDAGATIVTELANKDYYEQIWANPHTLSPDRLEQSKKSAAFLPFTGKQVLSDGKRSIEIHSISGNSHNDAFDLVYLPAEKLVIEADAYTPLPPGSPAPTSINPYSVNLYDNIHRLGLNAERIVGLHGRAVPVAELRTAIGLPKDEEPKARKGKWKSHKTKAVG
ncbi:MAG: MBL fold metallo-hydrolase [Methylococcaceae bacterium]|nr:MBL fold metallo-hydrolase [Methylococcaceae bacterium]